MMINDRPFIDKSFKPDKQSLQAALGSVYPCFINFLNMASAFSQAWIFSKTGGWMLKIYDSKKALFYLIPLTEGFKISLAIRENERNHYLREDRFNAIHEIILSSKKVSEGFALHFDITSPQDFLKIDQFIEKLIDFRH